MNSVMRRGREQGQPARIVAVDPVDGASGVFGDAAVVLSLSHVIDGGCLNPSCLAVHDPSGPVPGRVRLAEGGCLLVWTAGRRLVPGAVHFVIASGLRDAHGRAFPEHLSRFVPCDLDVTAFASDQEGLYS